MSATNPLGGSTSSTAAPLANARWVKPIREGPEEDRARAKVCWSDLGTAAPSGPQSGEDPRAGGQSWLFTLSPPHAFKHTHSGSRCSSPRLTGTPSFPPFAHLHIPPNKLFCVHLSFFDKLKEQQQKKRGRERERLSFSGLADIKVVECRL